MLAGGYLAEMLLALSTLGLAHAFEPDSLPRSLAEYLASFTAVFLLITIVPEVVGLRANWGGGTDLSAIMEISRRLGVVFVIGVVIFGVAILVLV